MSDPTKTTKNPTEHRMTAIRMLHNRDGAPKHTHVFTYLAGQVYSPDSEPPVSDDLMAGFVASGHALEVDASGATIGTVEEANAKKAASDRRAFVHTHPWLYPNGVSETEPAAVATPATSVAAGGDAQAAVLRTLAAQIEEMEAQISGLAPDKRAEVSAQITTLRAKLLDIALHGIGG